MSTKFRETVENRFHTCYNKSMESVFPQAVERRLIKMQIKDIARLAGAAPSAVESGAKSEGTHYIDFRILERESI